MVRHVRVMMVTLLVLTAVTIRPGACEASGADRASLGRLGTVDFPTSARSPEAQRHFLRGVAALHSFWYPVALDEFRAATRIEPSFVMGYWGEAMSHNHPLWGDPQETEAARKVLARVTSTRAVSARERAYLEAVQALYGPGDKAARDNAYALAMERLHRDYPDDQEAATFYALALLGALDEDERTAVRTRMRAGAIAQSVYARAPDHPGAAHYIIHAFDDPDHAILALPAARRYADIAPEAPHALHMPAHIFVQLGMWDEAATSNEASWAASVDWVRTHDLPASRRDYHTLHWLFYAYLQQGRYQRAHKVLTVMRKSLPDFPDDDSRASSYAAYLEASMAAGYVLATREWDQTGPLLATPHDVAHDGEPATASAWMMTLARTPTIFAAGFAAAMTKSPAWQEPLSKLRAIRQQVAGQDLPIAVPFPRLLEIQELEIAAAGKAASGDYEDAIATMRKATALVDAMPLPSGPPPVIKPAHELLGEILLAAGRPADAIEAFSTALFRHPARALSLLGAARAAARAGDRAAASRVYGTLARQWEHADSDAPEVQEVRRYSATAPLPSP